MPSRYTMKIRKRKRKKNKGVPKHKVKTSTTYKTYEETLKENKSETVQFNSIRSKHHNIYTINQVKQSLSSYDNKRYYLDSVNSLPYGHYMIKS